MIASRNIFLAFSAIIIGGTTSISSASFLIDTSAAEGRKSGGVTLASKPPKVYPVWPDTGIDNGITNAGTSDGVADQSTYTYELFNANETASASGSSTAATPAGSPALIGSLQVVSGAAVAGGAIASITDLTMGEGESGQQEYAGGSFQANHGASATVSGTAVNNGLYDVIMVGMLYTAVQGGCSGSNSPAQSTASYCAIDGESTAAIGGHHATAGFGEGQSSFDFQTFSVDINSGNASVTATAVVDVETSGGAATYFYNAGSANAGGTAVGVAAAYAWLIPDPAPAFAEGGFERMTIAITEGDNSFDNILDGDDISRIAAESRDRALVGGADPYSVFSGAEPLFDANYDLEVTYGITYTGGVVTDSDYLVRTLLGTEYGDVNLDGVVDTDDRTIIYAHWSGTGGWSEGDLNGDGYINGGDWSVWRDFEGFGVSVSIPEPTTSCLLIASLALCSQSRRLR
jgi:hypothetical protein